MTDTKIRKGGLVKLTTQAEESIKERFSFANETPYISGTSRMNEADCEAWRKGRDEAIAECIARGEDAWHITMNDAGESRLPPTSVSVKIYPNQAYQVLRARCVGYWSYRRWPGQCLVLDLETGREVYINRDYVEAV